MKKWSDNEIAEMFRSDGNLRGIYPAHILPRINLVKRTRELAVISLLTVTLPSELTPHVTAWHWSAKIYFITYYA